MQTHNYSGKPLSIAGSEFAWQMSPSGPLGIDLAPLPEGFRKALLKARHGVVSFESWGEQFVSTLGNVWSKSTVRQRRDAEPGVIKVLVSLLPTGGLTAWHMGYLAATCLDLDMKDLVIDPATGVDRDWTSDGEDFMRGVYNGGGVRVSMSVQDIVSNYLDTI